MQPVLSDEYHRTTLSSPLMPVEPDLLAVAVLVVAAGYRAEVHIVETADLHGVPAVPLRLGTETLSFGDRAPGTGL
jgi:hypothetical protein